MSNETVVEKDNVVSGETTADYEFEVSQLDDAALDKAIAQETVKEEKQAEPQAEIKTEGKQAEKKEEPPKVDVAAEIVKVKEENDKLKKQVSEKEKIFQRQANELGELRKKTAINKDEIKDKFNDDPVEAVRVIREAEDAENRIKQIEEDSYLSEIKGAMYNRISDFDSLLEPMTQILKDIDKLPEEAVNDFKRDPFRMASPDVLINLAGRARLMKENLTLKSEIETLKTKTSTIAENISRVARESNVIKATSGGTPKVITDYSSLTEESISELPDTALDEIIKNGG